MLCPPPLPPSRLAATEDPKGGGEGRKKGRHNERKERSATKQTRHANGSREKKAYICYFSLCKKSTRLLPAMLTFWPPFLYLLPAPFFQAGASFFFALFLFPFLSLIVPRGEEFFSAKIQPGRALAFSLPSVPLAGGERSEGGGGRRMSLSYG